MEHRRKWHLKWNFLLVLRYQSQLRSKSKRNLQKKVAGGAVCVFLESRREYQIFIYQTCCIFCWCSPLYFWCELSLNGSWTKVLTKKGLDYKPCCFKGVRVEVWFFSARIQSTSRLVLASFSHGMSLETFHCRSWHRLWRKIWISLNGCRCARLEQICHADY